MMRNILRQYIPASIANVFEMLSLTAWLQPTVLAFT